MAAKQDVDPKVALNESLAKLLDISSASLVRTNELGSAMDFRDGVPIFERTLSLFQALKDANLDHVPPSRLNNLKQSVDQAYSSFMAILNFDPAGQPSPVEVRNQLIANVDSQYEGQFNAVSPILAYSVRKGTDFDKLERDARNTLDELVRVRGEIEQAGRNLVKDATSSLEQVRRAAAEAGVAQHAVHFKQEAESHRGKGGKWLYATVGSAAVALIYAGWNIYYYTSHVIEYSTSQAIQLAIAKLLAFAVLSYAVVWCGRAYRSEMHNFVINQHRQNALNTFETFVKAASEPRIKDAVLIQATQCIFTQQPSGFSDQADRVDGAPRMFEFVRDASTIEGMVQKAAT